MAIVRETNGDAAAGADTRYTLSLDDVFRGTLSPAGDEDWVKVELSAGTVYLITLNSDEAITGENPFLLELFDAGGNRIVRNYESKPTAVYSSIVFEPKVTGSYYINAGSVDDGYSGSYEIVLAENTIPEGTYDEIADYLAGSDTSYAFDVGPGDTLTVNVNALTDDGQQLAAWALETWANVTGIHFRLVTGEADLTFISEPTPYSYGRADAVSPQGFALSATVNISSWDIEKLGNTMVSWLSELGTVIHEIGHALGLGHSGPYGSGLAMFGIDNVFLNDSWQITVMSYLNQSRNTYVDADFAYRVTPMIVDIIAIQDLYGVPTDINAGDTVYGYNSDVDGYQKEFFALWTGERNPLFHIGVERYSAPAFADLDGDGDPDAVIGDSEGAILFFENTGAMTEPDFTERAGADNPFQGVDAGGGFSKPVFVDLDGDGDLDVAVGTRRGDLMYLENAGTQSRPRFIEHSGAANPLNGINTIAAVSAPAFADLDNDGDPDMVVGDSDGDVHYFENIGTQANPRFIERTGAANPLHGANVGEWVNPSFVDLDNDGDADLIIANRQGAHYYFENTGESDTPVFIERAGVDNPLNGLQGGHYNAPAFTDLDNDGDPDLIIGNRYGNLSYFENAGTPAEPDFIATNFTNPTALTLYDTGGTDTLDLRTDRNDQRVYLRPEGISDVYGLRGNLVIARDTVIENFIAGSGNDRVVGNAVANYINGRGGDDRIWGGGGDDILEGGAGADRLDGDAGMDWVSYRESNAAVTVNLAENTVQGGHAQGDVLTEIENVIGSDYGDVLTGNDGANRLEGGAGADRLDGGAGEDWVSYQGSNEGVSVDLAEGKLEGGHAQGDVISNMENVTGSGHADVLKGDDNTNRLEGGGSDDRLWGGGGIDFLQGGNGDDWLYGSSGADRLDGDEGMDWVSYQGSDAAVTVNLAEGTVMGGHADGDVLTDIENVAGSDYEDVLIGNDGANRLEGGAGADRLDGGAGVDWALYSESDAGVTVNLSNNTASGGHAQGDTITGIENTAGSGYPDVLAGDDGPNRLYGGAGDDELRGNAGDDVLEGGAGADQLNGGTGVDRVSYRGSDAGVVVRLREGTGERGHAEGDVITEVEDVSGSAFNDGLVGDNGANTLAGNAGNDGLWGGHGDDVLEGGAGADRLFGGTGTDTVSYRSSGTGVVVNLKEGAAAGGHAQGDTITDVENLTGSVYRDVLVGDDGANRLDGDAGDDELKGGLGNDRLLGNLGDDRLYGGGGSDELRGSDGNDRLFGEAGDDSLYGGDADDELHGGSDNDQLYGETGEDILYGDKGDDELNGGDGNDRLVGEAGADELDGGSGIDWVSYQESDAGVTADLMEGTGEGGHAQGDVMTNVENLVGSGYADVLTGDAAANIVQGLDGDDELRGNGGNDVLEGGAGADQLDGGAGVDAVSYRDSDAGITVNLAGGPGEGGHAEGDVMTGIENVIGSGYDDRITGDNTANRLEGGDGDDQLRGGGGADRLDGGDGEDWVIYGGSDTGVTVNLEEGSGKGGDAEGDVMMDIEHVGGTSHNDVLIGDNGRNVLMGQDGNDELRGNDGNDWLRGRAGADRLDGGDGSDWASYWTSDAGVTVNLEDGTTEGGHAEGDVIINVENIQGSDHGDVLVGDNGVNYLRGLDGDDEIQGNGGDDRLYGGAGADIFIFETGHGDDTVYDFTDNEDRIDLSAFNLSGFDDLTITSISGRLKIDLSEYGGGDIVLQDFDIANLDATDFIL